MSRTVSNIIALLFCMVLIWNSYPTTVVQAEDEEISKIILSTNQVSLEIDEQKSITASAVYTDDSTKNITASTEWSSENPDVATVYNGTITGKNEGTTTIVAVYGEHVQSVQVTVTKKVKALTKDKQEVNLMINETEKVTVTATYGDNTTEDVSGKAKWHSDNADIATVVNGQIKGHRSGTATITATYGNQTVSIQANVEIAKRLDVHRSQVSLLSGETETIVLTATYHDGSTKDVTEQAEWTSNNEDIADVLKGVITAYDSGEATIKAEYGTKSATVQVDVDDTVKVEIGQESIFMRSDEKNQLQLTATYPDGSTADVTNLAEWSSSDENVVYVNKGELTAITPGVAVITAQYSDKTAEIKVNVDVVQHLDVNEDSLFLKRNEFRQLTLTATYIDGSTEDVADKAKWTSDDSDIAYVSDGKIMAYQTGEATITASYGGKTVVIDVDVNIPEELRMQPEDLSIKMDEEYEATLIAVYADGSEEVVTEDAVWTSSDSKIAEVDEGEITGISTGTATVTAEYGNKTADMKVHVGILQHLGIDRDELALRKKDSEQMKLTATYIDGTTEDVTDKAEWSSDNTDIAFVYKGKITAYESGTTFVTASYGNKTVQIRVEVEVPQDLTLSTDKLILDLNEEHQVTLYADYENGIREDVTEDAEWNTDNANVATVDEGLITGLDTGSATITATYENQAVTLKVEVNLVTELKASTNMLVMSVNDSRQIKLTATDSSGHEEDVTAEATWTSSDPTVVSVDKGLVVTFHQRGDETITATYGSKQIKIRVEVDQIEKIEVSHQFLSLRSGESVQLTATAVYSNGDTKDVTDEAEWISSDYEEVSVEDGLVKGISHGQTYVKVKYGGESLRIKVEVDKLKYLYTNEVRLNLTVGETFELKATAIYKDGHERDVTIDALWESSDIYTATAINGVVTATGEGKARISVEFGDKKTKVIVTVTK